MEGILLNVILDSINYKSVTRYLYFLLFCNCGVWVWGTWLGFSGLSYTATFISVLILLPHTYLTKSLDFADQ